MKNLEDMTLDELLGAEEDAYQDERDVSQFGGDWRPYAQRCAEITEEIEKRRANAHGGKRQWH